MLCGISKLGYVDTFKKYILLYHNIVLSCKVDDKCNEYLRAQY